jgi:PDZ domain-containing protein
MQLKFPIFVERFGRGRLSGACLLSLVLFSAGRPLAAEPPPDPESSRKQEPNQDKRESKKKTKMSLTPALPGLAPGISLEELLAGSGLSEDQFRMLTGQVPEDDLLKELMEERERVLRELQGLLGNPGMAPGMVPRGAANRTLPGLNASRQPEPRLGVGISKPGPTLIEQLELPKGHGLTLDELRPGSAADRAGLKAHDILLELDGRPVSSELTEFAKQLAAIPADKPIEAVILRRGRRETLKTLKLPRAKAIPPDVRVGNAFGSFPAPRGFGGFPVAGPGLQGFGLKPNPAAPAAPEVLTTTLRTFTTRHEEGNLVITLTGKVEDGKATVTQIEIQDGRESHKYASVEKVPEAYRNKVKPLVDGLKKEKAHNPTKGFFFDGVRRGFEGE